MTLNARQFHEMTKDEFEAQPGTFFHGNPTGNFNWEQPKSPYGFHVGSELSAREAVDARASYGRYSDGSVIPAPMPEHPETVRGGRITSPMVNQPHAMGRYGFQNWGDMTDSGDVLANAKAREITSKGQTMRRGIYYSNVAEDTGSTSAVLPSRQSFKTHEDHLVEARAQGKKIPKRALQGYTEIPGQQRLF